MLRDGLELHDGAVQISSQELSEREAVVSERHDPGGDRFLQEPLGGIQIPVTRCEVALQQRDRTEPVRLRRHRYRCSES